jgi:zinc-ribbon domain
MSQSRFCARCGRELAADAQFCPHCGTPRGGGAPAARLLPSNERAFSLFEASQEQTGNWWLDFLLFRRMIIPIIVRILFVVSLIVVAIAFLVELLQREIGAAFAFLIFGPLVARVYCELIILLFVMNDTLSDMRRTLVELRDAERARIA